MTVFANLSMKRFLASLSVLAMFFNVVPLHVLQAATSFNIDVDAFAVTSQGTFDSNAGTQSGTGAFANGNVGNQYGEYAESMCIPTLVDFAYQVTGRDVGSAAPGAASTRVYFDYFRAQGDGTFGYVGLENITTSLSDPADAADLSDFTYLVTEFGGNIQVPYYVDGAQQNDPRVLAGTLTAAVTGPFDGDNNDDGGVADADDEQRFYEINVTGVPENATAVVPLCARLSDDAGQFPGASLHLAAIQVNTSNLAELPEVTVIKTVVGSADPADMFTLNMVATNPSQASFSGSALLVLR